MNWFAGKTVVVPWDFSELSHQALQTALTMVDGPDKLHVVHVTGILSAVEPGVIWGTMSDDERKERLQKSYRENVDESLKGLAFHVAFGDPGSQIVDVAQDLGADVIVMPSHGRSALARILLGSVADRVVHLARCPVLILRE